MKLNYYKSNEDQGKFIQYLELDQEFYCHRSIVIENGKMYTSNVASGPAKYGLPEGSFESVIDQIATSSAREFLSIWKKANQHLAIELDNINASFPKGKKVKAKVICFYPQGVILDCNAAFKGWANYEDCLAEFTPSSMYPGETFDLMVTGIDEENLWINLATPTTYHDSHA